MIISDIKNSNIIVVDVQPEYENFIDFELNSFFQELNLAQSNGCNIYYLYNGADLGFLTELEYHHYLVDNGFSIKSNTSIFEKNYGFFRTLIDLGYPDDVIPIVKWMIKYDIYDSRDLKGDYDKLQSFLSEVIPNIEISGDTLLKTIFEDPIYIPSPNVIEYLHKIPDLPIYTCGGSYNECFKEIELCLSIIDKEFVTLYNYIY